MPDSTLSTLGMIRAKVRRLTRSPSTSQITDAEIDAYVNTFVLYDFPEHLRQFSLRSTFSFYAQPYVDVYSTTIDPTDTDNPFYNFKNKIISVHNPVYIAGYSSFYTQSTEQFLGLYPRTKSIQSIGSVGNGIATVYTGTLTNIPVLTHDVMFTSIGVANEAIVLQDVPHDPFDGAGTLYAEVIGGPNVPAGVINYITGVYSFTITAGVNQPIMSQTVPYVPGRPIAMLYYKEGFMLRPVPDQPYLVQMEAYIRPTELLTTSQMPDWSEWWQYIAYGTAKKIFQDRMDMESVDLITPEFNEQEKLILRRTLVQQSNERTSTIYTEQTTFTGAGNGSWPW